MLAAVAARQLFGEQLVRLRAREALVVAVLGIDLIVGGEPWVEAGDDTGSRLHVGGEVPVLGVDEQEPLARRILCSRRSPEAERRQQQRERAGQGARRPRQLSVPGFDRPRATNHPRVGP